MNIVVCRWDFVMLQTLLDEGARITLVIDAWEAANRDLDPSVMDRLVKVETISSFDSLEEIATLAMRLRERNEPVDAVLSLAEYSQLAAGYLARLMGLEEPDLETSVLVRDKRGMKTRARAAGVPCARQMELGRGDRRTAVIQAINTLGLPLVIKPIAGMGTANTWVVSSEKEALTHLSEIPPEAQMIAEEYIAGAEYHVDAVWLNGEPVVFGVGRYLVPRVEVVIPGHLNATALLRRKDHAELYDQVEIISRQINKAFGINHGITHVELFRTAEGRWIFSEIATRPGGDPIVQAYKLLGADLREIWARTVMGAEPRNLSLKESPASHLGIANYMPKSLGRVEKAPSEQALRDIPFVIDVMPGHQVGDVLTDLHLHLWSWRIFYLADSWEQFRDRTLMLEDEASFRIVPLDPNHTAE